jgi:hypothetical protein
VGTNIDGFAIDKLIVTDDPNYIPKSADDRVPPPAPVTGLRLVEAKPNEIAIAWDAHPALDLAYYSVYVGDRPGFALGNESVLASGHRTTACDWGIKCGATYCYKVVAVDRRGQSSAPAALEAKTQPMTVVTKELAVADAKVTEKLTRGKAEGLEIAYVAHLAGTVDQRCAFEFDVPQAGDYYLWAEYSPRSASARVLAFELDGAEFGNWTTHQAGRLGQDPKQPIAPGKERWLVERVVAGKGRYQNKPSDFVTLAAGRHALAVVFAGANAGKTPWLSKLWLSNDASFVPPGYSPQFRFNNLRRQK